MCEKHQRRPLNPRGHILKISGTPGRTPAQDQEPMIPADGGTEVPSAAPPDYHYLTYFLGFPAGPSHWS